MAAGAGKYGTPSCRLCIITQHVAQSMSGGIPCPTLSAMRPNIVSASAGSSSVSIVELTLGDSPTLWRDCGFYVSETGHTSIGSVQVRLTGTGGGLLALRLHGMPADVAPDGLLQGIDTSLAGEDKFHADDAAQRSPHPNGVMRLGEIVLYTQHVERAVTALQQIGISTHKARGVKTMKGGTHKLAIFFVDGIRLLLFGPVDPATPPSANPRLWMFPQSMERPTVLTGWLPIVRDINVLKSVLGDKAGSIKEAAQKGRKICSMAPERSRITGTFAFLSDGEGSLFD